MVVGNACVALSVDTCLVVLTGLNFMISIIVYFIPSLGIMHLLLPTWTGEDLILICDLGDLRIILFVNNHAWVVVTWEGYGHNKFNCDHFAL